MNKLYQDYTLCLHSYQVSLPHDSQLPNLANSTFGGSTGICSIAHHQEVHHAVSQEVTFFNTFTFTTADHLHDFSIAAHFRRFSTVAESSRLLCTGGRLHLHFHLTLTRVPHFKHQVVYSLSKKSRVTYSIWWMQIRINLNSVGLLPSPT